MVLLISIFGLLSSAPLVLSYLNVQSLHPNLLRQLQSTTGTSMHNKHLFNNKRYATRIEDIGRGGNNNEIRRYSIQSPLADKLPQRNIEVVYLDTSESTDESLLSSLTAMVANSRLSSDGLVVCGLDSESDRSGRVELIQLCMNDMTILIHRKSELFSSVYLRKFFLNKLFPDQKIVFVGAELATSDALDMLHIGLPIYGLLDLTPIFSQILNKKYTPPISFFDESDQTLSLKQMFNSIFDSRWLKDKAISNSDWSIKELTLSQVKYAALDAWTSAALGMYALQTHQQDGIYKMIFSTSNENGLTIRSSNNELLLKQIVRHARELENLKFKYPKCVDIENMQASPRKGAIEINCFSYGNRLHKNIKTVEIRIFSPGGSLAGVSLTATVSESKGRVSSITLDLESLDELDPSIAKDSEDQLRLVELQADPVHHIVKYWIAENDELGRYSPRKERQQHIRLTEKFVRVRLYCHEKPDELLRQVRVATSAFVRSHFVPRQFFPTGLRTKVLVERAAITGLLMKDSVQSTSNEAPRTIYSLGWSLLNGLEFENDANSLTNEQRQTIGSYIDSINPAQYTALQNAFLHKVSVIKGPPGTGKTRTIAAIADVVQKGKGRVLIIAPGNSSSRRILESLVKSGFDKACLIVSEDYFFEWHEEAYSGLTLGKYVHTKASFADAAQKSKKKLPLINLRAENRAIVDFRPREKQVHPNKWQEVAAGVCNEIDAKPIVVIGTYGTVALNGYSKPASSWQNQVQNLLDVGTIDMLIIDETSQLWLGHGKSLLPRLTAVKNIVLVGDNAQLAPHGEDQILHLKSLFDAAAQHPSVPSSVLNVTYRLTEPVAQILSKEIYDHGLVCQRVVQQELIFLRNMKAVIEALSSTQSSVNCKLLLQRLCETKTDSFASLNWIHLQSPAHVNPESHSLGNQQEADVVVSCVAQLLADLHSTSSSFPHDHENPAATKVIIITGYLEQKAIIEKDLCHQLSKLNYRDMDVVELSSWVKSSMIVNTVDSFQGQEADIVFISTVRSLANPKLKGLGFAQDQRRANVMLSRSSQLMVIVGDAINAALEQRTPPILLPSMSNWCNDHNTMFTVDGDSLTPFRLPGVTPRRKTSSKLHRLDWKQFAIKVKSALQAKDGGTMCMNELGRMFPRAIRPNSTTSLKTQIKAALGVDIKISRNAVALSSSSSDADLKDLTSLDSSMITGDGGGSFQSSSAAFNSSSITQLQRGPQADDKKSKNRVINALRRLMRWMVGLP